MIWPRAIRPSRVESVLAVLLLVYSVAEATLSDEQPLLTAVRLLAAVVPPVAVAFSRRHPEYAASAMVAVLVLSSVHGSPSGTLGAGFAWLAIAFGVAAWSRQPWPWDGDAYTRARELGRDPQPGLALLCLADGRVDAAHASIRAALYAVSSDRLARAGLCAAQVEIGLAADDLDTARWACVELENAAATYGTSGLEAAALHARGAVVLAEGRPQAALPALRAACRRWNAVQAPYEVARACALLGRAYDLLGDRGAAVAELSSARETFERLGAKADSSAVAERLGLRRWPGGLSAREAEVLTHVAQGKTNRQVADELVLSEKTVARHLSNILVMCDLTNPCTLALAFAKR